MMRYVAGFAIANERALLVRKQKPAWQAGRLNAIGGKIEQAESASQAMVREFAEETGLHIVPPSWHRFCVLRGTQPEEWEVHFFVAHIPYNLMLQAQNVTDEEILRVPFCNITSANSIPNLPWLLAMAVNMDQDLHAPVREYVISEQY